MFAAMRRAYRQPALPSRWCSVLSGTKEQIDRRTLTTPGSQASFGAFNGYLG
jgi:hypothetical protein